MPTKEINVKMRETLRDLIFTYIPRRGSHENTFSSGVIYLAPFWTPQLPYPDSYQIKTSVLTCVIGAVMVRVLTNQHVKSQGNDQRGERVPL